MSLNPSAKHQQDSSTFSGLDFLFAALAHVLVAILIAIIMWWQNTHIIPEPLKRIEVSMISAKDLQQLMHPPKAQKKHLKPTPKKIVKPKPIKPRTALAPVLKPKPVVKSKPVKTKAAEPDYDPFAPVESTSNKKSTKARSTPKPDIADIMGKQLSKNEIERYIAMMQAAVQQHWKVPGGISDNTPDPLVEMTLRRDGGLVSVHILESSGDATLDQTLISAIQAAAPFNLPKQQFESFRVNRIRFHPLK